MVTSRDVLPLSYRDSCVCITVSNSPNPSPVYIRLCKHGKGFPLNVFYKLSFPRRNAKLLVMALIKEKLSPVVKSCTRILARVITSCFCKKYAFQILNFSRLKCQLKRKKLTQHVCKDFQVSPDEGKLCI